jgi:SAM-dependent methyltransferase
MSTTTIDSAAAPRALPDQFKTLVVAEWTAQETTAAWRAWYAKSTVQLAGLTAAVIEAAHLAAGMRVLDIASGSGDPAIALSAQVGPSGHVTATDLAAEMLAIAEENARASGRTNISLRQADAHDLPFADRTFDAVTVRLGAMYFWDCPRALAEIRRVLRPGGYAGFVCWAGPEQNPYLAVALGPFIKRRELPQPPADAPQPLRFAAAGSLSAELKNAGFAAVSEEVRTVPGPWPGSPEELWQQFYDVAVPLQPYIDSFSASEREAALPEVFAGYRVYFDGRSTDVPIGIVVASARR